MSAPRCAICHRVLSDPVSIKRGIGPVCGRRVGFRFHSGLKHEGDDMFCPDFTYFVVDGVLVIEDLNLGGPSVTNGVEQVLRKIGQLDVSVLALPCVYRDSYGLYDQLVIKDGRFCDFGMIGADNQADAVAAVTRQSARNR